MSANGRKLRVGVLLGDPAGIGPELVAKLLVSREAAQSAEILVIGDKQVYRRGLEVAGVADTEPHFLDYAPSLGEFPLAQVSPAAGEYTVGSLRVAIQALSDRTVDAIVYAPLNKQAMKRAGLGHDDELHFFASLLGFAGTVSEINVCGSLWTSRVTSHIPLSAVASSITVEKIWAAGSLLHNTLISAGVLAPRIAVAALNPHAGEGGLIGSEEITIIAPAVEQLRRNKVNAEGPLPADTLFIREVRGDFDGVVTMYHDQGQIALKLLGFDRGVTVSGGLPVPIVTPAHGTAFDIAGKGVADVSAMKEAFQVACRMAAQLGSRR